VRQLEVKHAGCVQRLHPPAVDETLSAYPTVQQVNGNGTVQIVGSSAQNISPDLRDMGEDPGGAGADV
jgi:hypothetical protein